MSLLITLAGPKNKVCVVAKSFSMTMIVNMFHVVT